MPNGPAEPRVVVEVARRGKLVVGEPYFTPGTPIVLDAKGSATSSRATSPSSGSGRGRARVERALGPRQPDRERARGAARRAGRAGRRSSRTSCPSRALEGRVDLRELTTFTIDPETAKDFDDALSFRREPDGIRAWVHIADVSYFVPAGTPLDRGAAERAFSTYVPGLVAPMLPPELADDACSLRPHAGPALRHRRDAARRRAALLPLGDPLRRAAHLRPGRAARGAARDPRAARAGRRAVAGAAARRAASRAARSQVETPEVVVSLRGRPRRGRVARERAARAHARRGADDPRERARRRVPRRAAAGRRSTASTSGPTRRRSRCCSRS